MLKLEEFVPANLQLHFVARGEGIFLTEDKANILAS
jgi:hypothetical protein